jgi:hypothetical protein
MSIEIAPDTLQANLETLKLDEKDSSVAKGSNTNNVSTQSSVRKVPFERPAASASVPTPPTLSADEQAKYDDVLNHLKSMAAFPTSSAKKNKQTAPLSEVEQYFLSRECILRYLRATKWNVNDAKKRLEGTIVWRREYGTDTITADTVEAEVVAPDDKAQVLGTDGKTDIIRIR